MSVVLIDGKQLAHLMIEHDLGVVTEEVYKVKSLRSDYFNDE
jgi:restriction system protein